MSTNEIGTPEIWKNESVKAFAQEIVASGTDEGLGADQICVALCAVIAVTIKTSWPKADHAYLIAQARDTIEGFVIEGFDLDRVGGVN